MTMPTTRFGLSCALTTPFRETGEVDLPRLVAHARWCLDAGCASVTAFGTTGEGASIGLAGREQILGALAGNGFDLRRDVIGGVAAASSHEAIAQARIVLDLGCRAMLLAPPFYFKHVSDEGLFRWFSTLIDRLGSNARDVILYHIPSVTEVPLSIALIGRLRAAYPGVIAGVKDSSGDWGYAQALLAEHRDLTILIGDERRLAAAVRAGAQGSICGIANFCPELMRPLAEEGRDDPRVTRIVDEILRHPVTPAVKALVAHRTGDPAWLRVGPPLMPLSTAEAERLAAVYDDILAAKAA